MRRFGIRHRRIKMSHARSLFMHPILTLLRAPPFLRDLAAGHQDRRAAQVAGGVGDGDRRPRRRGCAPSACLSSRPGSASAATAAATVPVPHERVSPTPRSCTRIDTAPLDGAVSTSTLTPSGNCARSNRTGAATSSAASSSTVRSGSTHARCGLPTSTARPRECAVRRRSPRPVPNWLALPISTVTSALVASPAVQHHRPRAGQRPDDELVAAFQAAGAQVVGEHPDAVAAHLRRSSRRRCGSPCTSRRPRRPRAAGRTRRLRVPRRRWSRAARRRRRGPRRRSHSAATAAGVSAAWRRRSGSSTKSFCVPCPLANFTCSGYVPPTPQRCRSTLSGSRTVEPGDAVVAAEPGPLPAHIAAGADERRLAGSPYRRRPPSRSAITWA